MSEANLAVAHQMVDAFNRHDVPAFGAALTPDAVIVPLRAALENVSYRGPDGAEHFFSDVDQIWTHVEVEPIELRPEGGPLPRSPGCKHADVTAASRWRCS